MNVITILTILLIVIPSIIAIILILLAVQNASKLRNESIHFPPPGRMVDVHNKKLHVYAEGEGERTLVFMSGQGTCSPTLDFKPLWMRLTEQYRIAVVEKSGYGWSDPSNSPREIDTLLEETRKALTLTGEKPPYVLVPHSMSGLEAIYWAQKYPAEVEAIIGLDPSTPAAMDLIPEILKTKWSFRLFMARQHFMWFVSRLGLSRFMPETDREKNLPLLKSSDLSDEDKNQYMALFYRSTYTKDMVREVRTLRDNAKTVSEKKIPVDTPMYFFISTEQEANVPGWKKALTEYLAKIAVSQRMVLDTGHYVHYDKASIITEEAVAFLENTGGQT